MQGRDSHRTVAGEFPNAVRAVIVVVRNVAEYSLGNSEGQMRAGEDRNRTVLK